MRRFAPAALAFALLLAGCHLDTSSPDGGFDAGPVYAIDAGFLFGAAIAGYQVEGGDNASDWGIWQSVPLGVSPCVTVAGCTGPDAGPDFPAHYPADIASAAGLGLNALRFSLEWERLQPVAGAAYDPGTLAYYHGVVNACLDAGLTPIATLSQGALPLWLHGLDAGTGEQPDAWVGGWRGFPGEDAGADARIVKAFGTYAGDMAREFGSQVHVWITLDSPMENALSAYVYGAFPPGGNDRLSDLQAAVVNLTHANGAAYDAIHAALPPDGGVPILVGTANVFRIYSPDPTAEPDSGYAAAQSMNYIVDFLLPNAFLNGDIDAYLQGGCTYSNVPPRGGGCGLFGVGGRADFLGITYRGPLALTPGTVDDFQGDNSLFLPGLPSSALIDDGGVTAAPVNELIDPTDLEEVLLVAHEQYPLLPIYVTELSLNENAEPDVERPAFVVRAVEAVQAAMASGVPVKGVFYRSLVDDFEWQYGFEPETGLFRVNFADPARARTATQGAQAFGQVAKSLGVTPTIEKQWEP